MLGTWIRIVVLLALTCCATHAEAQDGEWKGGAFVLGGSSSQTASNAASFRFDWPVPSTFRVLHRQKKSGHDTLVEHVMQASRVKSSTDVVIRCRSTRILELNGRDYRALPESRALGSVFALPDVLVSERGTFKRAVGFAAFIKRNAQQLERKLKTTAAGRARLQLMRRSLRAPRALACLERMKAAHWRDWVGLWADRAIREGTTATIASDGVMPNGRILKGPARIRHRGAARGSDAHVRLEFRRIVHGADALASLRSFTSISPAARPVFPKAELAPGQKVELEQTVRVVTDPQTLRPLTVHSTTTASLKFGERVKRTAEHEYTFDWSNHGDRDVR